MLRSRFTALMFVLSILTACTEPQVLDHFKCYVAEGEVPEHETLILQDQFHIEEGVRLVKLHYFCNPVTKSVGDIPHKADPNEDHLTCYKIEPDENFKAKVDASNQFGETEFETKKSELLCVPTVKHGFKKLPEDPEDCPGGNNCCCNMSDGAGGTWPDCDAGFECRRQVNTTNPNDAIQVCVPTGTPPGAPLQLNPSQPPFCRK